MSCSLSGICMLTSVIRHDSENIYIYSQSIITYMYMRIFILIIHSLHMLQNTSYKDGATPNYNAYRIW